MQHLSGFDGMWYAGDHSRTSKAIMGSLCIYEPTDSNDAADAAKVIARVQDRVKVLPPLRRRVEGVPIGINNQYWRECVVTVAEHVREQTLPAPGTDQQLGRAVADIMETGLDRSRPMWDLTIFHGLSGRRVAHLLRVHHAATDGGTMQRVFGLLSDYSDEFAPKPEDYPGPLLTDLQAKGEMARRGVVRTVLLPSQIFQVQRHTLRWLGGRLREDGVAAVPALVARMLPGALGRPLAKAVNARRGPQDRTVQPIQPRVVVPDSKFNAKINHERSYAFSVLPMPDLLRVSKYFGVTFHSLVAGLSASAARQYLIANGEPVDMPLIIMSPYSLRRGNERSFWANYAANFQAELPVHLSDPVERLRVTGRNVAASRANYDTMPTDIMVDMSRMMPQLLFDTVYGSVDHIPEEVLKRTSIGGNFTVSNIRGPKKRFVIWGQEMFGFFPVSFLGQGLAHNVTVSSYADELQIGFTACPTVFPDDELWKWPRYYRDSLQELLDIVGGGQESSPPSTGAAALSVSVPARTRKAGGARPASHKAATAKPSKAVKAVAASAPGSAPAGAAIPPGSAPATGRQAVAGKRPSPRSTAVTPAAEVPDQAAPPMGDLPVGPVGPLPVSPQAGESGNGVADVAAEQNGSPKAQNDGPTDGQHPAPDAHKGASDAAPEPSMAQEGSAPDADNG